MALILKDRVLESSTTTGTGSFTLTGAQTGYQSFSAIGNGNTTYYTIQGKNPDGTLTSEWEVGVGTWSTGNTLSRDTVLSNSLGTTAKIVFSAGAKDVFCDLPAVKAVVQDDTGNANITGVFTAGSLATNSYTSTTPVLSFNASNSGFASGATVAGSYLQTVLQNKSGTVGASTNYVLSNDLGTDSSYYGEFGMNSSVYSSSPSDFFSFNNGIYFSAHDGDVSIGSGNGYKTYFAWGTSGDKAHVINASGAIGLNTDITGTNNFGTAGQVLTSQGNAATPTWTTVSGGSGLTVNTTTITGGTSGRVLYDNAGTVGELATTGTGSVVLSDSPTITTALTVSGSTSYASINGIYIGHGGTVARADNIIYGTNIAFGSRYTTAIGYNALSGLTTGNYNTAVGRSALGSIVLGIGNTGIGETAGVKGLATNSDYNVCIGRSAGNTAEDGSSNNVFVGYNTQPTFGSGTPSRTAYNSIYIGYSAAGNDTATHSNEIVIGANARGSGDNTYTIGDSTVGAAIAYINASTTVRDINIVSPYATTQSIDYLGATIGTLSGTNPMTFGRSRSSQTVNIANGITDNGNTNTINIGTAGASGSTTLITIGSTLGTSTTTFNGYFKPPALASAPTYVKGAVYFDTTLNKLRVGGATTWETITSI